MGLETGTYITDLVPTNPTATDLLSQGDDHLRLIKNVTKNSLPNADRPQYFPRTSVKTADYLLLITDMERYFVSDATGGAITYSLPALTTDDDGWTARFIKDDVSANTVTIAGTINGDTDGFVLSKQYQDVNLLWTGTEWLAFSPIRFVDGVAVFDDVEVDGILTIASTSHFLVAGGTTAQRPVAAIFMFRYNTDLDCLEFTDNGTNWRPVAGSQVPAGLHSGLVLQNNATTGNSKIDYVAEELSVRIPGSTSFAQSTWAGTIDAGATGADGLDQGGLAASTWYAILAIYNRTTSAKKMMITTAAHFTSGMALPSGYDAYKRYGWTKTDESSHLKRIVQQGADAWYYGASAFQQIRAGAHGTASVGNYEEEDVTGLFPSTASYMFVSGYGAANTGGLGTIHLASDNVYDSASGAAPPPIGFNDGARSGIFGVLPVVIAGKFYYAANSSGGLACARGWRDNI